MPIVLPYKERKQETNKSEFKVWWENSRPTYKWCNAVFLGDIVSQMEYKYGVSSLNQESCPLA